MVAARYMAGVTGSGRTGLASSRASRWSSSASAAHTLAATRAGSSRPSLRILVVTPHLRARASRELEALDQPSGEVVELQPQYLAGAQERRLGERPDGGERLRRRLTSRRPDEERVDERGQLVRLRSRSPEELLDLERLSQRPAVDELAQQLLG